jgi:hypothetical protein
MQETWQETPAAIPAPVAMECSEVVGGSFHAVQKPSSGIPRGLSPGGWKRTTAHAAAGSSSRSCLVRLRVFSRNAKPKRSIS